MDSKEGTWVLDLTYDPNKSNDPSISLPSHPHHPTSPKAGFPSSYELFSSPAGQPTFQLRPTGLPTVFGWPPDADEDLGAKQNQKNDLTTRGEVDFNRRVLD